MSITYLTLLALALYVLALGYVTLRAHRSGHTADDFHTSSRNLPGWLAGMSNAVGWTDAFLLIFSTSLVLMYGYAYWVYLLITCAVGLGILAAKARRIRRLAHDANATTMGDLVAYQVSPRSAKLIEGIMLYYFLIWGVFQVILGAQILEQLAGFSHLSGVLLIVGVTTLYTALGGFKSVVRVDALQFLFIIGFLLLLFLPIHSITFAPLPSTASLTSIPWSDLLVLALSSTLFTIISGDLWQRIQAAKTERAAKHTLYWTGAFLCIPHALIFILAWNAHAALPDVPAEELFTTTVTQLLTPASLPFVIVAIAAILMSTLSTTLFAGAQSSARLLHTNRHATPSQRHVQGFMLLLASLMATIALLKVDFITLAFSLIYGMITGAPLLIAMLFLRRLKTPEAALFWFTGSWMTLFALLALTGYDFATGGWPYLLALIGTFLILLGTTARRPAKA
jgi:Na+/proline symporter